MPPLHYRGISLLSCVSMVFTCFSNNRITTYLDTMDLIEDEQNGFRKDGSYLDHIYVLSSINRNRINEKIRINKKKLFQRLSILKKRLIMWIEILCFIEYCNIIFMEKYIILLNLYIHSNTISCITINGCCLSWFKVNSGVRQGDPLLLSLFSLFKI